MPYFLFIPGDDYRDRYSVEAAYQKAQSEGDANYSPHGAFRKVSPEKSWEAIDFVNEFGPLELLDEQAPRRKIEEIDLIEFSEVDVSADPDESALTMRPVWVDLGDFWRKHWRFLSVARLWETRDSLDASLSVLSEIARAPGYPGIGARASGEFFWNNFPWRESGFYEWKRAANEPCVHAAVTEIIKAELDLQSDAMKIRWVTHERPLEGFRISPSAPSLWSAIWHLFARDTGNGLGWRVCPHCSMVFYPKRKDSYFCESRYQKLHAASRWWHEHKETELENRREKRSREAKHKTKIHRRRQSGAKETNETSHEDQKKETAQKRAVPVLATPTRR